MSCGVPLQNLNSVILKMLYNKFLYIYIKIYRKNLNEIVLIRHAELH